MKEHKTISLIHKEKSTSQRPTRKLKLKQLVRSFLASNWCHGVSRVAASSSRFSRFIWTIAIILATLACGYIITNSIYDFLKFNTVIEIKATRGKPIPFPQITMCHFYASNIDIDESHYNFKMLEKTLDFKVILEFQKTLFDCKNEIILF